MRPVGWFAFNIACVEGGTPLFRTDFGPDNLPHETGVVDRRVSFTKGCFLGQEVVARMERRGRASRTLVGLRVRRDLLPVASAQVFAQAGAGAGDSVGFVTSSTFSPMLGARPIAFAMMRAAHAGPGKTVLVGAEGEECQASVDDLRF